MTTTTDATVTPIKRPSRASRATARNDQAAAPKRTAPKSVPAKPETPVVAAKKPAGPTKTAQNRVIAAAMVKACADMIAKWPAARTGIPQEQAAASVASWLNYAPVAADGWDPRLPERSGAGGRGAKARKSA